MHGILQVFPSCCCCTNYKYQNFSMNIQCCFDDVLHVSFNHKTISAFVQSLVVSIR